MAMGSMEMNWGSTDSSVQCHSLLHKDKFRSLVFVHIPTDGVFVSQTRIQALATVILYSWQESNYVYKKKLQNLSEQYWAS